MEVNSLVFAQVINIEMGEKIVKWQSAMDLKSWLIGIALSLIYVAK